MHACEGPAARTHTLLAVRSTGEGAATRDLRNSNPASAALICRAAASRVAPVGREKQSRALSSCSPEASPRGGTGHEPHSTSMARHDTHTQMHMHACTSVPAAAPFRWAACTRRIWAAGRAAHASSTRCTWPCGLSGENAAGQKEASSGGRVGGAARGCHLGRSCFAPVRGAARRAGTHSQPTRKRERAESQLAPAPSAACRLWCG